MRVRSEDKINNAVGKTLETLSEVVLVDKQSIPIDLFHYIDQL